MIKAFVFGKFLPFHKGHEAMINFALTKCDFLTVLICCSDKEVISGSLRIKWIEKSFEGNKNVEILCFNYLEGNLPNSSVSSREISRVWSKKFKELFPDYKLLVTSEDYGNFIAEFMEIKHIAFDIPKQKFPVSASSIRENLFKNWNYLPQSVKQDYAIKVVVLGTESTGKTILSNKLAEYFKCSLVKEAGRDLIDNSNNFQFEDLQIVAAVHAKQIDEAVLGISPLIIIDTDIHITKSYSKFIFGRELEIEESIYVSNYADLYLYLNSDVDYFQDGTRLGESDRNLLDKSHREVLKEFDISFVEISGSWQNRFDHAKDEINQLLSRIKKSNKL